MNPITPRQFAEVAPPGRPRFVVDAIFFQSYTTGIARVWTEVLTQWAQSDFGAQVLVVDRDNTAPKIPGIARTIAPRFDPDDEASDVAMLQRVCDEAGASAFVSSYFTYPVQTPAVCVVYDMIPEFCGFDLTHDMWQRKHRTIRHARAYATISVSSLAHMLAYFPDIEPERIAIAYCGTSPAMYPRPQGEIDAARAKFGITRPYWLMIGSLTDYKNPKLSMYALQSHPVQDFEIVSTASYRPPDEELANFTTPDRYISARASEDELAALYSGAIALLYPSAAEGFGMPVIEAMACGCPAITSALTSLPEVGGDAALYIRVSDTLGMVEATRAVRTEPTRSRLIRAGLERARLFTWEKCARVLRQALEGV